MGVGHDTSGIRVKPKLIAQTAWAGFDVSIYDVDGNSDFNPEDIVVKVGKNNSVKSIIIGGTGPAEGLGISISGASSVGSIKDARKGAARPDRLHRLRRADQVHQAQVGHGGLQPQRPGLR